MNSSQMDMIITLLRIIDERHLLFIVSDCCQTNEIFMKKQKNKSVKDVWQE